MSETASLTETAKRAETDHDHGIEPSSDGAGISSVSMPQATSASPPDQDQTKSIASESTTDRDRDISNDAEHASGDSLDKETSGFTVKISLGGSNVCSGGDEENARDSGMDVETITFPFEEESRSRQKQLKDKKEAEDDEIMEDDSSLVGTKTSALSATDDGDGDKKEHDVAFESTTTPAGVKEDTLAEYSNITLSSSLHTTSKEGEDEEDGLPSNNMMSNNTATLTSTSHTSRSSSGIVNNVTTSTGGSSSMATSFLDALSEDQRRVRTRHLPGATGFRKLHKSEIKRDMALCKAMLLQARGKMSGRGRSGSMSTASNAGTKEDSSKTKESSKTDVDKMDVDGDGSSTLGGGGSEEQPPGSDEETAPATPVVVSASTGGGKTSSKSSAKSAPDNSIKPLPTAFTLPHPVTPSLCVDLDDKSILSATPNNITSGGINTTTHPHSTKEEQAQQFRVFSSPQVVESITAFNPPRPPESVGPKKMHRLCRWERNPHAVENDMNTYRKTVERTRLELRKAEVERERIELLGCHLRNHFLNQFRAMKEEMGLLNNVHTETQIECVKAAGLLTSKTRSKGGVHAMRDVISVLKSRGAKSDLSKDTAVPMAVDEDDCADASACYAPGVGGICADPSNPSLARGWLLPGDAVTSPYGCGSVVSVFGPTQLDVGAPSMVESAGPNRRQRGADTQDTHHGFGVLDPDVTAKGLVTTAAGSEKMPQSRETTSQRHQHQRQSGLTTILPPRICVRLPFGIGYLPPSSLTIMENPSSYSDAQLSNRWKAMMETAQVMGTSLDANTIENYRDNQEAIRLSNETLEKIGGDVVDKDENLIDSFHLPTTTANVNANADVTVCGGYDNTSIDSERAPRAVGVGTGGGTSSSGMDISGRCTHSATSENSSSIANTRLEGHLKSSKLENAGEAMGKLVRFGCGILPTPSYPGGALDQFSLDKLETNVEVLINRRGGVVGKPSNPCVPPAYKQWENQRHESRTLEGKVLQLRNEVHRQSRFRHLNERSCETGKDRRDRFEILLVEMKADLNSLKERLNEELIELGIDEEKAEELLVDYNKQEQDEEDDQELIKYDVHHDAPPKRRKEQCQAKSSRQKLDSLPRCDVTIQV